MPNVYRSTSTYIPSGGVTTTAVLHILADTQQEAFDNLLAQFQSNGDTIVSMGDPLLVGVVFATGSTATSVYYLDLTQIDSGDTATTTRPTLVVADSEENAIIAAQLIVEAAGGLMIGASISRRDHIDADTLLFAALLFPSLEAFATAVTANTAFTLFVSGSSTVLLSGVYLLDFSTLPDAVNDWGTQAEIDPAEAGNMDVLSGLGTSGLGSISPRNRKQMRFGGADFLDGEVCVLMNVLRRSTPDLNHSMDDMLSAQDNDGQLGPQYFNLPQLTEAPNSLQMRSLSGAFNLESFVADSVELQYMSGSGSVLLDDLFNSLFFWYAFHGTRLLAGGGPADGVIGNNERAVSALTNFKNLIYFMANSDFTDITSDWRSILAIKGSEYNITQFTNNAHTFDFSGLTPLIYPVRGDIPLIAGKDYVDPFGTYFDANFQAIIANGSLSFFVLPNMASATSFISTARLLNVGASGNPLELAVGDSPVNRYGLGGVIGRNGYTVILTEANNDIAVRKITNGVAGAPQEATGVNVGDNPTLTVSFAKEGANVRITVTDSVLGEILNYLDTSSAHQTWLTPCYVLVGTVGISAPIVTAVVP